jgi:uncharacterized membrane protein
MVLKYREIQLYVPIIFFVLIVVISVLIYFSLGHGTQVQTGSTRETTSFKAGLPVISRTP